MALGISNPIEWYESQPDDVIASWEAYNAVEPVGCEWERFASMMSMLESIVAGCYNPHLDKDKRMKPRRADEFLPPNFTERKPKRKATLKQQLMVLARAFGGNWNPNGNNNQ